MSDEPLFSPPTQWIKKCLFKMGQYDSPEDGQVAALRMSSVGQYALLYFHNEAFLTHRGPIGFQSPRQMPLLFVPWTPPCSHGSSHAFSHPPTPEDTNNNIRCVTKTAPEEFQDPELMRSVRSHVNSGVVVRRRRLTPRAKIRAIGGKGTPKHPLTCRGTSSAVESNTEVSQFMPREEALDIFQSYQVPRTPYFLTDATPQSPESEPGSPKAHKASKRTKRSVPARNPLSDEDQVLVQPPEGGEQWMNPLFSAAYQAHGPFEFAKPTPSNQPSPHNPFQAFLAPTRASINMPVVKYYCR